MRPQKGTYDLSKALRHTARDGTVFFANANAWRLQTEDGSVMIDYVKHGTLNRYTTVFLKFDGKERKISGPEDDNLTSTAQVIEGREPPVLVTQTLHRFSDTGDKFDSFEQQARVVDLMVDMWRSFSGDWVGAAHGERQSSELILTDEFLEKLERGDYVNG